MDIYLIGEEKCIDGVWGREVDGRFYTHYKLRSNSKSDVLNVYRKLDADTNHEYWLGKNSCIPLEVIAIGGLDVINLNKYIPKHIKDLENLKRGDVVWARTGEEWTRTTFIEKVPAGYITSDIFMPCGSVPPRWKGFYKEVYIKPPFTF